jgi:choline monooxygenase
MVEQANEPFTVDEDIRRASTPPSWLYTSPEAYARVRERVLARSWQLAPDAERASGARQLVPFVLLDGCLDEPLLLTRDADDKLRCMSNVCTHRGNLVASEAGQAPTLRCRYHGRRFALDGGCLSMPEFEGVVGFPSEADDLKQVAHGRLGRFLMVGVDPAFPLAELTDPVEARLGALIASGHRFDPARSRDYLVDASWLLYVDNYLEGFHIPFVHPTLAGALDYDAYRTELLPWGTLQIGIATGDDDLISLPPGSPDAGTRVAAYYFFLFPNLMLNVYPWGLSLNLVEPLGPARTRVRFLAYVADETKLDRGAGAGLDRVEREDEAVVEGVQRGLRSRLYRRGRYSPTRETGVHHFHRLLARLLGQEVHQ